MVLTDEKSLKESLGLLISLFTAIYIKDYCIKFRQSFLKAHVNGEH